MPSIDRYVKVTGAFDPEAIRVLGRAYDLACALVGHTAQPVAVREAIAKGIFEAAKQGERDLCRLRDAGLAAIEQPYARHFNGQGLGTSRSMAR
jgi:hypothetical protein